MWHFEILEEPEIYSPTLESAWHKYFDALDFDEDDLELEEFLAKLDYPNHVCFCITTHGMACGPTIQVVWYVINMDYEPDDEAS